MVYFCLFYISICSSYRPFHHPFSPLFVTIFFRKMTPYSSDYLYSTSYNCFLTWQTCIKLLSHTNPSPLSSQQHSCLNYSLKFPTSQRKALPSSLNLNVTGEKGRCDFPAIKLLNLSATMCEQWANIVTWESPYALSLACTCLRTSVFDLI